MVMSPHRTNPRKHWRLSQGPSTSQESWLYLFASSPWGWLGGNKADDTVALTNLPQETACWEGLSSKLSWRRLGMRRRRRRTRSWYWELGGWRVNSLIDLSVWQGG